MSLRSFSRPVIEIWTKKSRAGTCFSAVTVIRGVYHEEDVVREHFMDIKDDTSVCGTTEGCPPIMVRVLEVGEGRSSTEEEVVELNDLRLGRMPSRRII